MKNTARKILAAAIPCFAAKGKRGTTTRDVAKAAGVNVATLAYHFGGKGGLYDASVASLYERFLELDPQGIELPGTPREQLETIMRLLYQLAREHRVEVRLLLRHVLEEGQLPASVQEGGWTDLLLGRVKGILDRLGVSPPDDWRLRVQTLSFLLARYAVAVPEDLAPYVPGDASPQDAVEAHLADLAGALLVGGAAGGR